MYLGLFLWLPCAEGSPQKLACSGLEHVASGILVSFAVVEGRALNQQVDREAPKYWILQLEEILYRLIYRRGYQDPEREVVLTQGPIAS